MTSTQTKTIEPLHPKGFAKAKPKYNLIKGVLKNPFFSRYALKRYTNNREIPIKDIPILDNFTSTFTYKDRMPISRRDATKCKTSKDITVVPRSQTQYTSIFNKLKNPRSIEFSNMLGEYMKRLPASSGPNSLLKKLSLALFKPLPKIFVGINPIRMNLCLFNTSIYSLNLLIIEGARKMRSLKELCIVAYVVNGGPDGAISCFDGWNTL